MDFNKTFYLSKEARAPKWHLIDAEGKILGRLATEIAEILRGKNKAYYTPHTDAGDYVVVINAKKVKMTGEKETDKIYLSYSGWMGGQKERTPRQLLEKRPTEILQHAVKGMLPKNRLSGQVIKKLKIYAGSEHPHMGQI
ncbi:50S ribosomal protein L13 [candidate division TM6 bacterium RIFCSPHIGHO2_12_FULL_36_22]|nr:MAG: 50S ribosomal protein L13 [candidate division TM6 bacterium RIFCSPHIGHO2_12_FULL_36_22]